MRARNIKPGFFRNEQLMQVAPLGRLLFAGLWCLADREGRLLDRPRQIKWDVLPADDCDVDALLDELAQRGFIRRYEVEGNRYISVTGFQRNQSPHHREKASSLPPPLDTAPAQKQASAHLIPDSLIPDSLNPDSRQPKQSKTMPPLLLEDYQPPSPQQEALSRIAKHWQTLTGQKACLEDRQHLRQALNQGHSEEAIIHLLTALDSKAKHKPLRLSTILAKQLAKPADTEHFFSKPKDGNTKFTHSDSLVTSPSPPSHKPDWQKGFFGI